MVKPLLICMTPVRNEAWILHAFLKATSLWADYIIIADQMSTDGSREIAMQYPKVILIDNDNPDFNEADRQKLLIDRARQIDGDKILFGLDADEIFTANFSETEDWYKILNSKPGDVFWFQWAQVQSDGNSYWIPDVYFPWMFHDDGKEPHGNYVRNMHSMRIPYPIEEKQMYYVNNFKVLHFQPYYLKRNLAKQRFYMIVDYSLNRNKNVIALNRMYQIKKIKEKLFQITEDMFYKEKIHGFDLIENIYVNESKFWFDDYVSNMILRDGAKKYEKIDIWDRDFLKWYKINDPRSVKMKCIHTYLHYTKNINQFYLIRFIDFVMKKII